MLERGPELPAALIPAADRAIETGSEEGVAIAGELGGGEYARQDIGAADLSRGGNVEQPGAMRFFGGVSTGSDQQTLPISIEGEKTDRQIELHPVPDLLSCAIATANDAVAATGEQPTFAGQGDTQSVLGSANDLFDWMDVS